jgi:hypothetical protein
VSHDWWTYQVVTGIGGTAHYDARPSLRYRQHGLNLIGANKGLRARLVRLSAFASGRMVMWNDVNLNVLGRMRNLLTPHNALVLDRYARIRQGCMADAAVATVEVRCLPAKLHRQSRAFRRGAVQPAITAGWS